MSWGDSQLTAHVGVKLCKLLKLDLPEMPTALAETEKDKNRWRKYLKDTGEEQKRIPEMKAVAATPRLDLLNFEEPDAESSEIAEDVIGELDKLKSPNPLSTPLRGAGIGDPNDLEGIIKRLSFDKT